MPIYEYETIPEKEGGPVRRYEFRQSMSDPTLRVHPETGEKLRRVYSSFAVGGGEASPCGSSECACETGGGHHHHGGGCGCGCCH